MRNLVAISLVAAVVFAASATPAQDARPAGVVSHVKVLSDKVPDVSSLEAWTKSFITDGMSDQEKALVAWKSSCMFVYQDSPPSEGVHEGCVHDVIKSYNVYGYGMCCCAAARMEAMGRYLGMQARGWAISGHSVPEVMWDNQWHMLDASLLNYFTTDDGKIASVEDIQKAIKDWYASNGDYLNPPKGDRVPKGNDKKLRELQARDGWTGWKTGPALLANCKFYDAGGWWPAKTHGWYATMQEFDGSADGPKGDSHLYEYGYSQGYEVNIQLREGERLTRNWFNKGLNVNGKGDLGSLKKHDFLANAQAFTNKLDPKWPDLCEARVGSGLVEYDVPLKDPAFRAAALKAENLAAGSPALTVQDADKQGVLEIDMPSSYVYLTGKVHVEAVVVEGGGIRLFYSDNNGLDWTELATIDKSGASDIDISKSCARRYDYRLRVILKGKGSGLDALKITHDVQCSQRALPALGAGDNTISFSAGPQDGTVTIEGTSYPDHKNLNNIAMDFHPVLDRIQEQYFLAKEDGSSVTFPISTPGEMTCLRLGGFYRLRDAKDQWEMQVSFDGKEFKTVDTQTGPFQGICKYVTFKDVPPGTKEAFVRWVGKVRNTTALFTVRIDADYKQPAGGFAPVQVTYLWEEGGIEKKDVHVAKTPADTWKIRCDGKPTMKSIVLELAK